MKKQLVYLVVSSMMMLLVFLISKPKQASIPIMIESVEKTEDVIEPNVEDIEVLYYVIDIKGEVARPGVYEVEADSRIHEVIKQAGGFTSEANEWSINLAEKIKDEMVIYVPHIDEEVQQQWSQTSDSKKVSINQATEIELQTLPGIGSAKASAIVNYRIECGPFQSIEELKNVTGIGDKTFEALQEFIEL